MGPDFVIFSRDASSRERVLWTIAPVLARSESVRWTKPTIARHILKFDNVKMRARDNQSFVLLEDERRVGEVRHAVLCETRKQEMI